MSTVTVDPVAAAIEAADLPPLQGIPGREMSASAARETRAVRLRLAGMTYDQIAHEMGYHDRAAARAVVLRALDRYEGQQVSELRDMENARLDRAQAAIWPKVLSGDLRAVDTLIRLSARRSRMNGLDAPQQIEVSSGAQAALQDALADLRTVVLGEVLDVVDDDDPTD